MTAPTHKAVPHAHAAPAAAKARHFPPNSAGLRNKSPKDGEALEDVDPTDYDPRAVPDGTPIGYPDPGDRYPTTGVPYPDPDKVPPALTSITPTTGAIGDPSFTLHAIGTAFPPGAAIVWNGAPVPTTYVSDTELTTEVDLTSATAGAVPVLVRTITGTDTASQTFQVGEAAPLAKAAAPKAK